MNWNAELVYRVLRCTGARMGRSNYYLSLAFSFWEITEKQQTQIFVRNGFLALVDGSTPTDT